jgi:hypothetical protein
LEEDDVREINFICYVNPFRMGWSGVKVLLCQSYFMPNYRNFVAKIANFVPKTALF